MTTHYHLLLETPKPNLAVGMKLINSAYAQGFNRRHKRVGALFQGRYHSVVIETERQLLHTALYIAFNPVRAGLCAEPEDWPWSGSVLRGLTPR
jgi:REP element-mobilizing transposase RayT